MHALAKYSQERVCPKPRVIVPTRLTNAGSTSLTLSNDSSRIARNATTPDRWVSARGTLSKSSGIYYLEAKNIWDVGAGASAVSFGFGLTSFALDNGLQCVAGIGPNDIGVQSTGSIYIDSSTSQNIGAWTAAGSILRCVINLNTKKVWFQALGDANWNGTAGADPTTGAGGISLPGTSASSALYPIVSAYNSSVPDTIELNFGQFSFAAVKPAIADYWM